MTEHAAPAGRARPDGPARGGSDLILDMLARGIPLTLLPDLAWPRALGDDDGGAGERGTCTSATARDPRHGRHAGGHGRQESLQQALAFAVCPTGRHRREPAACAGSAETRTQPATDAVATRTGAVGCDFSAGQDAC